MNAGTPPEDRDGYLADEYHDRFLNAREYLREGHPPEDAADRADIPLDLFTDALDGSPEDIRGTHKTTCDCCGERVTNYVSRGGGSSSGTQWNLTPAGPSWCAWDEVGIPVDARPEGWREQRPDDGFPCPNCSEELTTDSLDYFQNGSPDYRHGVRCGHCGTELGGDDSE